MRDLDRVGRALAFFFLCLFAVLSFEGCSERHPQRAKDEADRRAIVGVWDYANRAGIPDGTGIWRLSSDGTCWQSNKIINDPSLHSRVADGKWNITNGELLTTELMISWDGEKHPQQDNVEHGRIVRLTDQELVLAFEVDGVYATNFYVTNIFRRAK